MRPDIKPGATFPDYELPDHESVPRKLSEIQGERIYNGYWFWGRPSFVDLWHDLRDITREIRPDWDLGVPGLREAWDAGDLSRFHGWNKRIPPTPSAA